MESVMPGDIKWEENKATAWMFEETGFYSRKWRKLPPPQFFEVPTLFTAGAGDAFLSGKAAGE